MKSAMRYLLLGTTAVIWSGCAGDAEQLSAGELALKDAGTHLVGNGSCATLAQIDEACPPDLEWDNHGQYVSCVARYLDARVEAGDIDEDDKGALVSVAARSSIGKKKGHEPDGVDDDRPDFGDCDDDGGFGGAGGHHDDDDDDDDDDDGFGGAGGCAEDEGDTAGAGGAN